MLRSLVGSEMCIRDRRGNDLTKLNRQVQLWVCPRFEQPTPYLCISYTGREPVFLLSFIPSASCRSNFFTILSPSPLRGVETPQQVQATSDRSRISTKAYSSITCVTGCATKSQLFFSSSVLTLSDHETFRFSHFLILTLSYSDTFKF